MKKEESTLHRIFDFFKNNQINNTGYQVPSLWVDSKSNGGIVTVDYTTFYTQKLEEILSYAKDIDYKRSLSLIKNEHHGIGGDWSYHSVIYNTFPRLTAAFDHNRSGDLEDYEVEGTVFKKTGTFLKMIALLPYLKSLGINTIHFMPISRVGADGNRGDLGSPYAIKNPYKIEEDLRETAIPFTVEEQFTALVEACHILDMRVVVEFVLRTAALDSDWIKDYPERFYWIKEEVKEQYHSPTFSNEELEEIKKIPCGGGGYHAPSESYQSLFSAPPSAKDVYLEKGKYKADSPDGTLIVPSAFADWPPDDEQPPWGDVTYLRMFDDAKVEENFNYIAYNTIRYYHPSLAVPENRVQQLWDDLSGIIPYFQEEFGIDGVMLDMGHALPKALLSHIIEKARSIDSDFGFWEENFEISKHSRNTGFNGALGFEWKLDEHESGIRNMILYASNSLPLPFFGTAETHNTPRRRSLEIKKQLWILNSLLPSCMPFIHNGFELDEKHPVNTGLNFTTEELQKYEHFPLALFHKQAFDWSIEPVMVKFIQKLAKLRLKNEEWIATGDERTLTMLYPENRFGRVIAFERHDAFQPWKSILVIMNTNFERDEKFFLNLQGTYNNCYIDYLSGKNYCFEDHWLSTELVAGQSLLFEMHKLI